MLADMRKNTLCNISSLVNKVKRWAANERKEGTQLLANSMLNHLELVRNDILLILNQNFYLQCRLKQKDQQLQQHCKQLSQLNSQHELSLAMLKLKYDKKIQSVKFTNFAHCTNQQSAVEGEQFQNKIYKKGKQQRISHKQGQSTHENNQFSAKKKKYSDLYQIREETVKKNKQFQQIQKQTSNYPNTVNNQPICQNTKVFDIELILPDNLVMTEQITNTCLQPFEEIIKSNQRQDTKKKKKKSRGSSVGKKEQAYVRNKREQNLGHRKKKSEQLAELVAQQFKVQPMKQKYFSTDLF